MIDLNYRGIINRDHCWKCKKKVEPSDRMMTVDVCLQCWTKVWNKDKTTCMETLLRIAEITE